MKPRFVVFAAIAVAGCKHVDSEQALGATIAQRFETCWGFWNDARWEQLATCYAPDAIAEEPGAGRPPARGPDAIVAGLKRLKTAFPDMKGEPVLELVDDNNNLVSIVLLHGTQTAPLETPTGVIAPTGRTAGVLVSQVIEMDGDGLRIERAALYGDLATLVGQLAPPRDREVRAPIDAPPRHKRVVITTGDERERMNTTIVPQLIYLLNQHDLAELDSVIDDDIVWSEAAAPADQDDAALRATLAAMWKAMPDLTYRATSLYRAGSYIAIAGTIEGTRHGEHVVVPYDAIHQLDGVKITRTWVFSQGTPLARGTP